MDTEGEGGAGDLGRCYLTRKDKMVSRCLKASKSISDGESGVPWRQRRRMLGEVLLFPTQEGSFPSLYVLELAGAAILELTNPLGYTVSCIGVSIRILQSWTLLSKPYRYSFMTMVLGRNLRTF